MPIAGYPHNFLQGLSDFWQRFFADADQLASLYQGVAILMGQAYLDMLANVLNVSLQDATIFNKELYHLIVLREDELHFEAGATTNADRWAAALPDGLVSFISLDNRVVEPTASLQQNIDYDLTATEIRFRGDPTNPGLPGFARRQLDVTTGGLFTDSAVPTWESVGVDKGDLIRLLDIGLDPLNPQQRKRSDHPIVLVRAAGLYVGEQSPLPPPASGLAYVILRQPFDNTVVLEALMFTTAQPGVTVASLGHTRLDEGSVTVFAKGPSGADAVEGIDYAVDYEGGHLYRLTSWLPSSANVVSYTWRQEVYPLAGSSPRFSPTGRVVATSTTAAPVTTRVLQIAMWAPDALVDRGTLAANFGALIGSQEASSEAYRAFLRGIFQLYLLGPVLERMESALNVILGLPVIRDDGEILDHVDLSSSSFNTVVTRRPSTGSLATYQFPKETALRPDVLGASNAGVLTFNAFEPLTVAATVTDYVQDPTWWYNAVIPPQLFATTGGAQLPDPSRRTASPELVKHVVGAADAPKVGDPGLLVGQNENGLAPSTIGHPIFRHRLAFVLMDRYFKFHTFFVKFDPSVFTPSNVGVKFERSVDDLNRLIFSAKPAHTFIFVAPATSFTDTMIVDDTNGDIYQPQRYAGANPNGPEIFPSVGALPDPNQPYVLLGLFLNGTIRGEDDQVIFTDRFPQIGDVDFRAGDYLRYELATVMADFTSDGTPQSLPGAPPAPRRAHLVRAFVGGSRSARRLVESVDYTVDYLNRTVTRLTTWDVVAPIAVTYVQMNIGNLVDTPPDRANGDTFTVVAGIAPGLVRASYDPNAVDLFGNPWPVTDHRDISLVERQLTIRVH
jgi:hypothetical protein